MVYEALSTLSGVDTDSAYQAGLMFEHDVAMAKAQDARHWQVDAKLTPAADGARLDVIARDAAGQPLSRHGRPRLIFERPTDRRFDRSVVLAEDSRRPLSWRRRRRGRPMGSRHRADAARRGDVPLEEPRHFEVNAAMAETLDLPQFIERSDDGTAHMTFAVDGVGCAGCIRKIESGLSSCRA